MLKRTTTVKASDEQVARVKASKLLDTTPENVSVTQGAPGAFNVALLNADAELEIELSEDKLEAVVIQGEPAVGQGQRMSYERLVNALSAANVRIAPIPESAKLIISTLSKGQAVSNVVIARGRRPEPARDAKVEPLGDWHFPALPGDAIGKIIPSKRAVEGRLVTGERKLDGPQDGKGIRFPEGSGCYIDKTALLVRAEHYGIVSTHEQEVYCSSLISVSSDAMEVKACIFSHDFKKSPLSPERMQGALEAYGIEGKVDRFNLATAAEEAASNNGFVKDVVICRGVLPIHGQDGWFEMLFKDDRPSFGVEQENGRMDYRARGIVRAIRLGDIIGKLHPPKLGVPGKDVYGKIIPAREGILLKLDLGESVRHDTLRDEFYAEMDGMVLFQRNRLAISETFCVEKDVDISTGNLILEKGSVHVKGSVLAGFSINSPGNILVNDVVESAVLEAGGDIEIKGGILMDKGGKISSKGGVSALFAKNATIESYGDVNIAHEINNCIVFAARKVIATRGRGKIIGSTIRCGKGLEANELGSSLGVETHIFLGIERKSLEKESAKKKELHAVLHKIYAVLGTGNPKVILSNAPKEKRAAVASLLKTRLQAEQGLKEIEKRFEAERMRMRRAYNARIKVYKTIYPGTIFNCFGASFRVAESVSYSQVYYDPVVDKIVISSL